MPVDLEIERKFLVKLPQSWADFAELMDDVIDVKRIWQTYLTPKNGEPAARIRKTVEGFKNETKTVYHFNQKTPTKDTGVHQEKEHTITEKQYQDYLKQADPNKCEVSKTRFVFKYHDQIFELDLFRGHLKGLAILEIELNDKDDIVEIPEFLKVIKEITSEKKFNNFNLANKSLKHR